MNRHDPSRGVRTPVGFLVRSASKSYTQNVDLGGAAFGGPGTSRGLWTENDRPCDQPIGGFVVPGLVHPA